ncbi:MAG: beta-glucanase (GH16 family) [Sediminicola sp.]|jgi:beta-glucanase (GH16 family)
MKIQITMKINYGFALIIILMSLQMHGQEMPIDFSDSAEIFIPYQGSGFSTRSDPNDSSNIVGEFFNDGSNPSQGFYLDVLVDLDIQQNINLSFYSFDPNPHNILLKLENGLNPNVEVLETFTVPSPSNWQTISFDFTDAINSSDGTTVNATGTYSRLVIIIDHEALIPGTYLIDDVTDGAEPIDPNILDVIYTDLVWSDEFDTNGAIDESKWHHQIIGPNGGQWFNGELQHYTNRTDNSFVDDGNLNIVAKRESFSQDGITLDFTSARLNSKFAYTYGRVDVRAKLPFGNGTWPAIWGLGKNINEVGGYWYEQGFGTTNWPACGELDVMEHGLHATNEVSSAVHTTSSSGNTVNTARQVLPNVAENYHVYSMNWSPDQITFMIDGVGFYTYSPSIQNNDTWPFDLEQYLILNVAMGGFAGAIDPSFSESSMVIDYVRVYQNILKVEDTFAEKFVIYPNPASDSIAINTTEDIDRIQLYSVLGELVINNENTTNHIAISQLRSGLYLLKIYSGNNVVTKKVVIE